MGFSNHIKPLFTSFSIFAIKAVEGFHIIRFYQKNETNVRQETKLEILLTVNRVLHAWRLLKKFYDVNTNNSGC